jgi:hypothetical protein
MRHIHHIVFAALFLAGVLASSRSAFAQSDGAKLDERILKDTDREFGGVYRDMGVVQRKAMNKENRLLLSLFGSLDLSDLPYSNLGLNVDVGWAFSDFFEVYFHYSPFFMNQLRNYAKQLDQYTDGSGNTPLVNLSKMKAGYGVTIVWAPSYGKDSIGSQTILRSDTFFKFSYSRTSFEGLNTATLVKEKNGANTYTLGVGKTFFFGKYVGARVVANAIYSGVPDLSGVVKNFFIGGIEFGSVLYW